MIDIQKSNSRIYEFFAAICKIPHPSSHCDGIRAFLKHTAETHGLICREDAAGNVRIDRKNQNFSEALLMQSHMDMVPQSVDGKFDFVNMPIKFEESDGFLYSKDRQTTLGADNGIGMAISLAALIDEGLADLPLAALFTVDEETGLTGAANIDSNMLDCCAIFNLDSEHLGDIIIGSAGGIQLQSVFTPAAGQMPSGLVPVKVTFSGLKGGHSGGDINLNRGNAILMMLDFIIESGVEVSSLCGGNLANAIPRFAEFTGAAIDIDKLKEFAASFSSKMISQYDTFENFSVNVSEYEQPIDSCVDNAAEFFSAIRNKPYEVIAVDEARKCVKSSSNLAIIKGNANRIEITLSIRSLLTAEINDIVHKFADDFESLGADNIISDGYDAWESSVPEEMLDQFRTVYRQLFNQDCTIKCIHAGLECGLFQSKAPGIPIISFGPTIHDPHSPSESLDLASVKNFYIFLCTMFEKILKK